MIKQHLDWAATATANTELLGFLAVFLLSVTTWAIWNCMTRLTGIDRLTWLVALIAMPVYGLILFLFKGIDEGKGKYKTLDDL